jgi:hypothetical protein
MNNLGELRTPHHLKGGEESSLQNNNVLNNSTTMDNVQKVNNCEKMHLVPRVNTLKLRNNISHYDGLFRCLVPQYMLMDSQVKLSVSFN